MRAARRSGGEYIYYIYTAQQQQLGAARVLILIIPRGEWGAATLSRGGGAPGSLSLSLSLSVVVGGNAEGYTVAEGESESLSSS